MSKLFSCFACTEKRKRRKYGDDMKDDKMPKEKKSKKGKTQKRVKDNNSEPLNNQVIIPPKDHNSENFKDTKHVEICSEVHPATQKMAEEGGVGDISRSHEPHSNNPSIEESQEKLSNAVPQIQINNGGNARARSDSESSGENSSDAGSCLTDSDLNISEAVFITEEGPRVGSLGASLSRMGLQAMRASTENERRLERELIDRASVNSWSKCTSASSNPRLSADVGKISKEERN